MKWKLTNISRGQSLIGLCPGQSKEVTELDETILHLHEKQLLSIKEASNNNSGDKKVAKKIATGQVEQQDAGVDSTAAVVATEGPKIVKG